MAILKVPTFSHSLVCPNAFPRIEVKATDKKQWPVGHRALAETNKKDGIFWVLVLLPQGDAPPRYFVFTGKEIADLAAQRHGNYMEDFGRRHGRAYQGLSVPTLLIPDVLPFENRWGSITSYLTEQ